MKKVGLDDFLMAKGKEGFEKLLEKPAWEFGSIKADEYPKKVRDNTITPLLKKLVLTSKIELDPIISTMNAKTGVGKRILKAGIKENYEKWRGTLKRVDNGKQVDWAKNSTGNTQIIKDIVKALEKEDDLFLYGDEKTLATIRHGELLVFYEPAKLATEISTRIDFRILTLSNEALKPEYAMFPPNLVSGVSLLAAKSKKLKHVITVAKSPLYLGGNAYYKPGYYEEVKLLYIGKEIKPIKGLHYTRKALNYPYASIKSAVNALGSFVGATFLRAEMPGAHPSVIIQGDDQNLGKTSLADSMSIVATGDRVAQVTFKTNEEELEKEIGAHAKSSDFIALENIKSSNVSSPLLERLITAKYFETRQLGSSELIRRRNDMQMFFTGNGAKFSKDIVVRSVPIFLSSANAQVRKSILDYAEDHREEILGELLNLVLTWIEKGSQKAHVRFDKFQKWADIVNGILVSAGIEGFLSNFEESAGKLDPLTTAILDVAVDEILESEEKKTRFRSSREWRQKLESSGYVKFFKNIESLRGKDTTVGIALRKMQGKTYPIKDMENAGPCRTLTDLCERKKYVLYAFEVSGDESNGECRTSARPVPDLRTGKITEGNEDVKLSAEPAGPTRRKTEKLLKKENSEGVFLYSSQDGGRASRSGKSPLWWQGEYIGEKFSFDTETTLIEHEGHVPDYILGSAFNGSECYFIRPEDLKAFTEAHKDSIWIMHNASFDMTVVEKVTGNRELFFKLIDSRKICDSMLLAKLLHIAKGGNYNKKTRSTVEARNVRESFSLAAQAKKVLGIDLDKTQEVDGEKVRLSYEKYKGRLDEMPQEYFDYNTLDTMATYELWEALKQEAEEICSLYGVDKSLLLSHWTEVEKAYAAKLTSLLGVRADEKALDEVAEYINEEYEKNLKHMTETYDYFPGTGESDRFQAAMKKAEEGSGGLELVKKFNKTKKAELYSSSEKDLKPKSKVPFIADYLKLKKAMTLRNTFANKLKAHIVNGKIHPKITTCLDTGRVAFSKPNLQQIPRPTKDVDLRKFILPPHEGDVFYGVDNSAAELVALGDRLVRDFGHSKMSEAINKGVDLHKLTATTVTGKKYEEISKEDRQLAKALNFGFPGGLSAKSFTGYAEASYGVKVTEEEATKLKEDWFLTYPEMKQYMRSATQSIVDLISPYKMEHMKGWQPYYTLRDLAAGNKENRFGWEYTEKETDWAWETLRILSEKYTHVFTNFREDIAARKPSEELAGEIEYLRTAILPSGRIRGKCNYNNFLNNSFQGSQADIAGTAWYQLWRNGYEVAHMVHDEVQVSLPSDSSPTKEIDKIILDAAKKWCPNTTMRIESEFSPHWKK